MRVAIERKELLARIQHLVSIVPTKSTSPILNNYLIEASEEKNTIRICATDLQLLVVVEIPAAVAESGTIAISAHHFNEIINCMPDAVINLWQHDELLMIQSGKVDFNLLIADHTLFPVIPDPQNKNVITISAELFNRMIAKTYFAVSSDPNRTALNGVCWKIFPDYHIMVATDGRKVAEIKVLHTSLLPALVNDEETELNIFMEQEQKYVERIIPVKTLMFLQKIYNEDVKELKIGLERNRIEFIYGEYFISSQVLEHKYPDYQKAFPVELPNKFVIDKNNLITAIKRVALVAPDDNMRIHFDLDSNHFEVNASNRDTGEAKEDIDEYNYSGNSTGISFNFKYMLSILEAIDTEKVVINLGTSKDPMMIYNETPVPDQELTFLLMPLRS